MSLGIVLPSSLILMLMGFILAWPYSQTWGYLPSAVLGIVIFAVWVLLLMENF